MKHIFIINPAAGVGKARDVFLPDILEELKHADADYEIHRTINVGDGERFTRSRCAGREKETDLLRFYACGGDGTLSETVNGAAGFKNVEVACIPAGSGNDFIRNFGTEKMFSCLKSQLEGKAAPADLLRYRADGGPARYSINLINIGVDCIAVKHMEAAKRAGFLRGKAAYLYGTGRAFSGLRGFDLSVTAEEEALFSGEVTLLVLGNGTTYGGGFRAAPRARVDDGLLDLFMVRKIGRARFLSMVGDYKRGKLPERKSAAELTEYRQCRRVTAESDTPFDFCADGELFRASSLEVEIIPGGILFSAPRQE